ncbi:MAG: hypothetical protein V3T48_13385 [Vicinamibacterales bacterium]
MRQTRRRGLVAAVAVVAQMGIASLAAGQSPPSAWESVTGDRLLTPQDGD